MKIRVNRIFLTSVAFLLLGIVNVSAQDHLVKPLADFIETYRYKEHIISKELEGNVDKSSFNKKLIVYNNKLSKLREDFITKRKLEYQLKTVKRARKSSCKGTHVRRVTDCESVLVKAPNDNMYTMAEWAKVSKDGDAKRIKVFIDSSFVSLKISTSGMKINKASVHTIFKYKPELIDAIVEKETTELFNDILKNKNKSTKKFVAGL